MAEQDFLARIRAAEKQAADSIEDARAAARSRQDDARDRAAELISQARNEAARIQQLAIEHATVEAERVMTESNRTTRTDIEQLKAQSAERLELAAARIAERIVNDRGNR